jgi:hypothetical protein
VKERGSASRMSRIGQSGHSGEHNSDTGIPGPTILEVASAALVVEVIRDHNPPQEFHTLVAELRLDSEPQRSAVTDRQIAPVHSVRQDGLRMQCIQHVYAVGRFIIGVVLHESSSRMKLANCHCRREDC